MLITSLRRGDPDCRLGDAIQLVRSKQQSDGSGRLENSHPGRVWFELEEPSRWNTLRALRVLHWYDEWAR